MAEARADNGRRFSLILYVGIVFLFTWPFQFAIHFWAGCIPQAIGLSAISMWMVGIATLLADRIIFRQGFASAGWGWGKARDYILVLCLAVFLWIVPAVVEHYWTGWSLPKGLTVVGFARIFAVLTFVLVGATFGEELGWRGYLLPRLAARTTPRQAVLIQGLIWFCWHLPLVGTGIVAGGVEVAAGTGLSRGITIPAVTLLAALSGTMHGVVLAFIWSRTRSLAVVTVYHAAYNIFRDSVSLTVGLASLSAWWAVSVLSVLGLILLVRGNWEDLRRSDQPDRSIGQLDQRQEEHSPQAKNG